MRTTCRFLLTVLLLTLLASPVLAASGDVYNLGTLGGTTSTGMGVNAAGQVTGISVTADGELAAFLYSGSPGSGGAMANLGTLGGLSSFGNAINPRGQVTGDSYFSRSSNTHAFLYTCTPGSGGAMADLGTLGGGTSRAWGINAYGQVAGESDTTDAARHAFLYTGRPGVNGKMIDLDAWLDTVNPAEGAKWTLNAAQGLTDTGLITGVGDYNDGPGGLTDGSRAFLLEASTLVPEPATGIFLIIALLSVGTASRRRVQRSTVRCHGRSRSYSGAAALSAVTLMGPSVSAAFIPVYGGPIDKTATLGYTYSPQIVVNDAGTAIGNMDTYVAPYHSRIFRWDGSGAAAVELGNLGTNVPGVLTVTAHAQAINTAGIAIGYARKWDGAVNKGYRAVRWNASGTAATELGNLGTDPNGVTHSLANAMNDAGTAVGVARKYDGSGSDMGLRAVRWDASGTAATELANLGANNSDTGVIPLAINNAGTAVGYVAKYDENGLIADSRAVRWDALGAATQLKSPGPDVAGNMLSQARAINAAGTAIGYSDYRAVRWDASGTSPTVLKNHSVDPSGFVHATAINDAGAIVGAGTKNSYGNFPIRWDPASTTATELGNLGTDSNGQTTAEPQDINNAGFAVGYAEKYINATDKGQRAVLWGLDGAVIDLNTLIDPTSGWTLWSATDISDTGWIAGAGFFDPDGVGGQAQFRRMFLMQVPATSVPEPATEALAGIGLVTIGLASCRRSRRSVVTVESSKQSGR